MLVSLPGVEVFSQALGEDDAAEGQVANGRTCLSAVAFYDEVSILLDLCS